jgi:hypothetical protein
MKRNRILLGFACLLLCMQLNYSATAQNKTKPPLWVTMMDDPNVNYFEAVKNFNDYWKTREKPVEEGDLFESVGDKEKEESIKQKKRRLRTEDPAKKYAFEYKRFLWWMREVEPFVQTDGKIKGMNERISEWRTQQQQRKTQEQKEKGKPSDQ